MILDELALYARVRVDKAKERIPLEEIRDRACLAPKRQNSFEAALEKDGVSFITEIKKASPSKGIIDAEFDWLKIAKEYEDMGADCISCLTEPKWFLGSDEIFKDVRAAVSLPMLRKDFTVDEYQIYEAKCMGADAVLLICSILTARQLEAYLEIADGLGLAALIETHSEDEIRTALDCGAKIIGVNNRNLKDFSMDLSNAERLRAQVPPDKIFVAESGIKTPQDIKAMKSVGADAVLIGETLMRAENKKAVFAVLKGET